MQVHGRHELPSAVQRALAIVDARHSEKLRLGDLAKEVYSQNCEANAREDSDIGDLRLRGLETAPGAFRTLLVS
jgi:hypothetical protein